MVRVWLISIALLALLTATASGDDDAKQAQIESLREEVSTAIESGEWKAAKRPRALMFMRGRNGAFTGPGRRFMWPPWRGMLLPMQ